MIAAICSTAIDAGFGWGFGGESTGDGNTQERQLPK